LLSLCCAWALPTASTSVKTNKLHQTAAFLGVFFLSCVALFFGVKELRGGVPLLLSQQAVETGTWNPQRVDRDQAIPKLKEANRIAPSYRRHLKLAILYRLEAEQVLQEDPERSSQLFSASRDELIDAHKRNPYDPVIAVNLASIFMELKDYQHSHEYFELANGLSGRRGDRRFGIFWKWAELHHLQAVEMWKDGDTVSAHKHFATSLNLLLQSTFRKDDWKRSYLNLVSDYLRFYISLDNDSGIDVLVNNVKNKHKGTSPREVNALLAEYYHARGKAVWYKRRPDAAYRYLDQARKYYLRSHKQSRNYKALKEVEEILKFLRQAGIKGVEGESN